MIIDISDVQPTPQDLSKVEGGGLARALLVLKVMESSECPAAELAKACRIENALVASGAPTGVVTKTIAALLEPRNKVVQPCILLDE